MSDFKSFLEAPANKVLTYFLVFGNLIFPGCVILFFYYNKSFTEVSTAKVILLSAGIVFPFYIVNLVLVFLRYMKLLDKRLNIQPPVIGELAISAIYTTLAIYGAIFLRMLSKGTIVNLIMNYFKILAILILLTELIFKERKVEKK